MASNTYRDARDRAGRWLLSLQNRDGSVGDPREGFFYYRIPWTFAILGENVRAARFIAWLRTNMLKVDANLGGAYPLGGYNAQYSYLLGNIVIGTTLTGDLDLARKGVAILSELQDPRSGGVPNVREPLAKSNRIETWISAQAGLAFLSTGRVDAATSVGKFLVRVLKDQPDFPKRLHFVYDRSTGQIITESAGDKSIYLIDSQSDRRQMYFAPGLISGFLALLYLATGQTSFLAAGMKYQDFVQGCRATQFHGIEVCKTGWGAALLFRVTGDRIYSQWAKRVGDYFIASQQPDGRWTDDRYDQPTLGQDIALTAQNIVWTDSISSALKS